MSRPDFPKPYCPLTPEMIYRIISDQECYDRDPERAEREQAEAEERRRLEEEEMHQFFEEQWEDE